MWCWLWIVGGLFEVRMIRRVGTGASQIFLVCVGGSPSDWLALGGESILTNEGDCAGGGEGWHGHLHRRSTDCQPRTRHVPVWLLLTDPRQIKVMHHLPPPPRTGTPIQSACFHHPAVRMSSVKIDWFKAALSVIPTDEATTSADLIRPPVCSSYDTIKLYYKFTKLLLLFTKLLYTVICMLYIYMIWYCDIY